MSVLETSASGQVSVKNRTEDTAQGLRTRIEDLEHLIEVLARGKYQWESTFDAIQDPVVIINRNYAIERVNRAAETSSQIPIRDLIGTLCYESLAGRALPCPSCPLPDMYASQSAQSVRLDPFPRNGRRYEVNAYPILEKDGDSNQAVIHYRDISDEETLQRHLLESRKLAAIGTLAGGVAHEINNPLAGILAFSQLILRRIDSTSPFYDDLKEIEKSAIRCKEIVEDLLDFSRTPLSDEIVSVNLNQVIRQLLPLINVRMTTHPLELKMVFDPELPLACGKANKLQQVVLNLITNAMDAMKATAGAITLRTFVQMDAHTNWVCLEVKDEGTGIDPSHLHKIFDPFFSTKAQGEGTGLGLAISYGIVKECGGRIECSSSIGNGTCMLVCLPQFSGETDIL